MEKKNLLCGVAFNYHDSSVSFALDDQVLLVLEAERVFRLKKKGCNSKEMERLILYGLNLLNKDADDVSYWALETLLNPWLDEKDRYPNPPVWRDINILGKKRKSLVINHHLSHAAAFLFTQMDTATIFNCDGGGDFGERVTVYTGNGTTLTKENFNVSDFITAKPYDLCATYLYNYPRCEGKLMALAAYGTPKGEYISRLEGLLPILCTTTYEVGDEVLTKAFPGLKGKASSLNVDACDFSASVQEVFVRHRMRDIGKVTETFRNQNLVLSGGACLNLEVNTEVWKTLNYSQIFIPPCCDDTGQSLGAISYLITELFGTRPNMELPFVGIGRAHFSFSQKNIDELVDNLLDNQIIIVHNSKAEIGPRALGNRSFIARPDSMEVKEILNHQIKAREDYRPLAPMVLEEKVHEYFIGPNKSPFMLDQYEVRRNVRALIEGVIHRNNTARAQTVTRKHNPFMYDLIKRFGERTGIYVLVNTSLNLKGEPISNTIEQTMSISSKIKQSHKVVYNGVVVK